MSDLLPEQRLRLDRITGKVELLTGIASDMADALREIVLQSDDEWARGFAAATLRRTALLTEGPKVGVLSAPRRRRWWRR